MDGNENLELNTEETIEETETETDAPEDDEDNAEDPAVDDPTSDGEDDEEIEENFLGTFKTKEDADKGFKSAQAKITEQANKIKELEAKIKGSDTQQSLPDVDQEIAKARQNVFAEYNNRLRGLGVKYSSYIPNDVQINSIEDIVANLPPIDAARFMNEFNAIQNECNGKLDKEIADIRSNANAKYEEIKAADKERYKDNELVFNAWYNPPETIEGVAELVENVRKKAIEDYIKEQAAKQEDEKHKGKLNTTANTNTGKFKDGHIFTRSEIDKMSDAEFAKNEEEISRQVAAGLIKD